MQMPLDLPERRILTVSDLTSLIKSALEESFYDIWMEEKYQTSAYQPQAMFILH